MKWLCKHYAGAATLNRYQLWGNFDNCGETLEYRNQYSKVSGKILEYGKILQQFLETLGEILHR